MWIGGNQVGIGVYKYANGDIFKGEWIGGRKHGQGIHITAAGSVFLEVWEDGVRTSRIRVSGAADDAPQTDESDAENFNVHDADGASLEDSAEVPSGENV